MTVAAAYLLFGCGRGQQAEDPVSAPFVLSHEMLDSVRIDTVRGAQIQSQVELSGKVTADESKVLKIYPMLSGYAEDVRVQLGDYVRKGQVLAVVHSGEIADYEKQLSDAQSDFSVAKKKLQVQQDLYDSRLATDKDVADAQSDVQKSASEIARVNDLFHIYKKGSGSTYIITAPISGYVIEKNVNNGMEIRNDNTQNLFTLSEINDVWVMANVFESDIPKIKEGYDADVIAISYPDHIFHGKIDKIYNFLDPATKTMQVRIKINNENQLLKPEMFASVKVHYPEKDSMAAVPASALIFDNNLDYVLVYKSNSDISVREVMPLKTTGNLTFIQKGLRPGERIISKNQLLIYNALAQN